MRTKGEYDRLENLNLRSRNIMLTKLEPLKGIIMKINVWIALAGTTTLLACGSSSSSSTSTTSTPQSSVTSTVHPQQTVNGYKYVPVSASTDSSSIYLAINPFDSNNQEDWEIELDSDLTRTTNNRSIASEVYKGKYAETKYNAIGNPNGGSTGAATMTVSSDAERLSFKGDGFYLDGKSWDWDSGTFSGEDGSASIYGGTDIVGGYVGLDGTNIVTGVFAGSSE